MSFDTSSAFQSVQTERDFDSLRPWWDLFSSYIADSMVVIALLAVSLQVFGGLGSGVKCVPIFEPSEAKRAISWPQRGFVDANCAEDGLSYMAQYLGYILMLLIWILMAIDNFWAKWSKTRVVLKSFVNLVQECHSSPCKRETVIHQLNASVGKFDEQLWDPLDQEWLRKRRGVRVRAKNFKQTKLSSEDIQSAILLSQKATEFLCQTAGTFTLFRVYKVKSVFKVLASLGFSVLIFVRRFYHDDLRFEFRCDEKNFNVTLQVDETGGRRAKDIIDYVNFTCNFKVGPFLDIVVLIFAIQLALYAIFSICGLFGWQTLDRALNEIKNEFKTTKEVETAEEKLEKITMSSDIKLLLYLLRYANKQYYDSLSDFVSPRFQGHLIQLATNRKWSEDNLRSKATIVDYGNFKGLSMNLADMDLHEIPRGVFSFAHELVVLDISYNEDVKSVAGIKELKNLKNLDLEGCGIEELGEIVELKELVLLDLMHNRIKDIPDSIEALQQLEQLKIKGNDLKTLPSCINDKMPNLRILICEKTVVRSIDGNEKYWADRAEYVEVFQRKRNSPPTGLRLHSSS